MHLAYSLFLRSGAEAGLLGNRADPEVSAAERIAREVRRDIHKMRAFVRFRELPRQGDRRRFVAWFEPGHRIEEVNAPFFQRRFGDMDWLIVTPEVTVACRDGALTLVEEANADPRHADALEELWRTYFANIFNPARLKVKAMTAEMPKKYWKNLPEAALIPEMIAGAGRRAEAMRAAAPTAPPMRAGRIREREAAKAETGEMPEGLPGLARELDGCRRCPLWRDATQAVPGEGPGRARVMIVGEQPGDQEDLAGRPFVGPAGTLFDRIAAEAGLDRAEAWVTNAVKHFKFTPRGKRRIHQKPDAGEVEACRWWLEREKALVGAGGDRGDGGDGAGGADRGREGDPEAAGAVRGGAGRRAGLRDGASELSFAAAGRGGAGAGGGGVQGGFAGRGGGASGGVMGPRGVQFGVSRLGHIPK